MPCRRNAVLIDAANIAAFFEFPSNDGLHTALTCKNYNNDVFAYHSINYQVARRRLERLLESWVYGADAQGLGPHETACQIDHNVNDRCKWYRLPMKKLLCEATRRVDPIVVHGADPMGNIVLDYMHLLDG